MKYWLSLLQSMYSWGEPERAPNLVTWLGLRVYIIIMVRTSYPIWIQILFLRITHYVKKVTVDHARAIFQI